MVAVPVIVRSPRPLATPLPIAPVAPVGPTGFVPNAINRVLVERFGRSSVSPFILGPDRTGIRLRHGVAGYLRQGRWAVMATGPAAVPGREVDAVGELLARLRNLRLRPLFAAVVDPTPYEAHGLVSRPVAEDAVIELKDFSLAGKRRANIRHSVTSARRAGLRVVPWSADLEDQAAAVSGAWLSGKRGGEMGFTLGRFDAAAMASCETRVVLDEGGLVVALATWHTYDDGRGRVLDLMRRAPDAPNPSMDLLIAESLLEFSAAGVERASLGAVPLSRGSFAERIYPTRSLRRYKDKFAPTWEMHHLVGPSRMLLPAAFMALGRAYCPGGLVRGLRRNG
jgi:phosphatidylglycerol lysyltransferase